MPQVAADALGLSMRAVTFRLGDSLMPPTGPHGGSTTMASVGTAVQNGGDQVRDQVITLAVNDSRSPLHGARPEDILVRDGRLQLKNDPTRGETYRQLLVRNNRAHLEVIASFNPSWQTGFSTSAYGALFAEVAVDTRLGLVRVRRMLAVYDADRIINPKLADSQALGGNAPEANPICVKGLGEVVIVGVAAAVGNAVFNATGHRVRDFPITAEATALTVVTTSPRSRRSECGLHRTGSVACDGYHVAGV
jgi:xanthine dehydrogenase YagR molybdenum-binding subunit